MSDEILTAAERQKLAMLLQSVEYAPVRKLIAFCKEKGRDVCATISVNHRFYQGMVAGLIHFEQLLEIMAKPVQEKEEEVDYEGYADRGRNGRVAIGGY